MYITLLSLHIAGAVIMAIVTLVSLLSVGLKKSAHYSTLAGTVLGLGLVQIISGALLSIASSTSILVMCSKLFGYLAITIALEIFLLKQISKSKETAASILRSQENLAR